MGMNLLTAYVEFVGRDVSFNATLDELMNETEATVRQVGKATEDISGLSERMGQAVADGTSAAADSFGELGQEVAGLSRSADSAAQSMDQIGSGMESAGEEAADTGAAVADLLKALNNVKSIGVIGMAFKLGMSIASNIGQWSQDFERAMHEAGLQKDDGGWLLKLIFKPAIESGDRLGQALYNVAFPSNRVPSADELREKQATAAAKGQAAETAIGDEAQAAAQGARDRLAAEFREREESMQDMLSRSRVKFLESGDANGRTMEEVLASREEADIRDRVEGTQRRLAENSQRNRGDMEPVERAKAEAEQAALEEQLGQLADRARDAARRLAEVTAAADKNRRDDAQRQAELDAKQAEEGKRKQANAEEAARKAAERAEPRVTAPVEERFQSSVFSAEQLSGSIQQSILDGVIKNMAAAADGVQRVDSVTGDIERAVNDRQLTRDQQLEFDQVAKLASIESNTARQITLLERIERKVDFDVGWA